MVRAVGKGTCERCGVFLKLNFVARRHPVNKLRVEVLNDTFVREYNPTTQRLRSMCEQLAAVTEQLETMKPGSPDHQRLVQLSVLLGETLEASRRPLPDGPGGVDDMNVDQLLDVTAGILDQLLAMRDADGKREDASPSPFDSSPIVDLPAPAVHVDAEQPTTEPAPVIDRRRNFDSATPPERPPDPDLVSRPLIPYGPERDAVTRNIWRRFGIVPPKY
jgi:hypothetical protein